MLRIRNRGFLGGIPLAIVLMSAGETPRLQEELRQASRDAEYIYDAIRAVGSRSLNCNASLEEGQPQTTLVFVATVEGLSFRDMGDVNEYFVSWGFDGSLSEVTIIPSGQGLESRQPLLLEQTAAFATVLRTGRLCTDKANKERKERNQT